MYPIIVTVCTHFSIEYCVVLQTCILIGNDIFSVLTCYGGYRMYIIWIVHKFYYYHQKYLFINKVYII